MLLLVNKLDFSWKRSAATLYRSEGRDSLMQVIYIVQPSSLTHSLMFVCLSLFHLIPIKMLFQSNWTFPSCQWGLPILMLCTDSWGEQEKYDYERLSCHKMPYHRKSSDTVYIKVFFDSPFGFIIFLYHVFDSLKRRLRLNSHFSESVLR